MGPDGTLTLLLAAAALAGLLRLLRTARNLAPPATPAAPTASPLPPWLRPRPSPLPPPFAPGVALRTDLAELLRGATEGLAGVELRLPEERVVVRAPWGSQELLRRALVPAQSSGATVVQACEYDLRDDGAGVVIRVGRSPCDEPPTFHLRVSPTPRSGRRGLRSFDPEVRDLPWEARYTRMLEHCREQDLRDDAYRFAGWAEALVSYARRHGARTAACPSVGLNVDPWLLAAGGLRVVAFDRAAAAIEAVAHPGRRRQVYSAAAKLAWTLEDASRWADGVSPHAFGASPDLGHPDVLAALGPRVVALVGDWARLPLAGGAVDVLFATNALPREEGDEALRAAVLAEWGRVLRPGGVAVVCMHNAGQLAREARAFFAARGLREVEVRDPDAPPPGPAGAFQVVRSSG